MGCGVQNEQKEVEQEQEDDGEINAYTYKFNSLYPVEIISGFFIQYCVDRQIVGRVQREGGTGDVNGVEPIPITQNAEKMAELHKVYLKRRSLFKNDTDERLRQYIKRNDQSLQQKYALIREQQKQRQQQQPQQDGEPDTYLEPSRAPDHLQYFTVDEQIYLVSFSEMYQIIKEVLPYLAAYDLYQVLCYLSCNGAAGHASAHDQVAFQQVQSSTRRVYSHSTFTQVFNVVQPANFAKINTNNLHIFFGFSEIYTNDFADVELIRMLMHHHFGSCHREIIDAALAPFDDVWFISKTAFNQLLKTKFTPLAAADSVRVVTKNYGVNLKIFIQKIKDKQKQHQKFLDDQIDQYEAQISRDREMQNAILDNRSQQNVLDYNEAKERKDRQFAEFK